MGIMTNSDDGSNSTSTPQPGQMRGRRVDMTQGHLLRQIVYLSWPIVTASLLQVAVGIADIKMVGVIGSDAIAAVGMARSVVFTLIAIVFAVSTGVQVLVAQYSGSGDRANADATVKQGLITIAVATLAVVTPVGLALSGWIMARLGATEAVMAHGVPYLQILFGGMVFILLSFVITAALQGAGDTLTPLILLVFANALNILLNYLFIFGVGPFPRMGVPGAGVGTVVSRLLAALAGVIILMSGRFAVTVHRRRSWAIRWDLWRRIFYLGIPASIQGFTRSIAFMIIIKILSLTAAAMYAISAYTIAGQIQGVTILVGLAMMAAATTAVGQNIGAGDTQRAAASGWLSAKLAGGLSIVAAITYALLDPALIRLFSTDAQVIRVGTEALIVLAISEPFLTAAMSLSGSLRGAGDTYSPLYISLACTSVLVPLLCYLLAIAAGMGTMGVWIAFDIAMGAQCLLLVWKFGQGRWKKLSVT